MNLEYLDLGFGDITTIPDSISKLTSLKYFNMFGNKLTSLPKGFPLNLTSLILRANLFKEFPKQIYQMKDLELLDVSMNEITTIEPLTK